MKGTTLRSTRSLAHVGRHSALEHFPKPKKKSPRPTALCLAIEQKNDDSRPRQCWIYLYTERVSGETWDQLNKPQPFPPKVGKVFFFAG